jgi:hypothetical protein
MSIDGWAQGYLPDWAWYAYRWIANHSRARSRQPNFFKHMRYCYRLRAAMRKL